MRYIWVAAMIAGLAAGLFASSYVFYYAPVTQDRFGHAYFSGYASERAAAYWTLFKSRTLHGVRSVPRDEIEAYVEEQACEIGVSPALAKAVIWFESGFRAEHISTTGAMGLMALMPETAATLGVTDPFDPFENMRAGTRLLKQFSDRFDGDMALIAAAYNAGPTAVERHGGVPPYPETEDYVKSIHILYDGLRGDAGDARAGAARDGADWPREATSCSGHRTQ